MVAVTEYRHSHPSGTMTDDASTFAPHRSASAISQRARMAWRGGRSAMKSAATSRRMQTRWALDENGIPEKGERHGPGHARKKAASNTAIHEVVRAYRDEGIWKSVFVESDMEYRRGAS